MHKEKGTKATVVLVFLFFQHTPYVQGTYLFSSLFQQYFLTLLVFKI